MDPVPTTVDVDWEYELLKKDERIVELEKKIEQLERDKKILNEKLQTSQETISYLQNKFDMMYDRGNDFNRFHYHPYDFY